MVAKYRLFDYNFFRIHRSYLVNMDCVKHFNEYEFSIELTNNKFIGVSRRKLMAFKKHVEQKKLPVFKY